MRGLGAGLICSRLPLSFFRWISRHGHCWWHGLGCGGAGWTHWTSSLQVQILKTASPALCPGVPGSLGDTGRGSCPSSPSPSFSSPTRRHLYSLRDLQPPIPWHLLFNPKSCFAMSVNKIGLWLGNLCVLESVEGGAGSLGALWPPLRPSRFLCQHPSPRPSFLPYPESTTQEQGTARRTWLFHRPRILGENRRGNSSLGFMTVISSDPLSCLGVFHCRGPPLGFLQKPPPFPSFVFLPPPLSSTQSFSFGGHGWVT